jgi:hypothetical protein
MKYANGFQPSERRIDRLNSCRHRAKMTKNVILTYIYLDQKCNLTLNCKCRCNKIVDQVGRFLPIFSSNSLTSQIVSLSTGFLRRSAIFYAGRRNKSSRCLLRRLSRPQDVGTPFNSTRCLVIWVVRDHQETETESDWFSIN